MIRCNHKAREYTIAIVEHGRTRFPRLCSPCLLRFWSGL